MRRWLSAVWEFVFCIFVLLPLWYLLRLIGVVGKEDTWD